MKNKFPVVILIFLLTALLFSCGNAKKDINIDVSEVASKLSSELASEKAGLVELTEDSSAIRYGIVGLYSKMYCEASVTVASDEFAVIEASDEQTAGEIVNKLDAYRKERISLFASYAASEVPKLEDALLESEGKYVIFVSSDKLDAAKEIWNSAKKQ
ncbi:MAG: DUF4358 domain-containing protein [Eubacteriales bacterium]